MAHQETRRCECGTTYSVLTHRGVTLTIEATDDRETCPACASGAFKRVIGIPLGIELGGEGGVGRGYPYFDRALRCRVSSARHRRQIMKRKGLVAVDGDIDLEGDARKEAAENAATLARYHQYGDDLDNHPDFAEYREMRDKGALR